jgi:hypothetical protein
LAKGATQFLLPVQNMQNRLMNKNQGNVKRLELLCFKAIGSQKSKFEPNTQNRE